MTKAEFIEKWAWENFETGAYALLWMGDEKAILEDLRGKSMNLSYRGNTLLADGFPVGAIPSLLADCER